MGRIGILQMATAGIVLTLIGIAVITVISLYAAPLLPYECPFYRREWAFG